MYIIAHKVAGRRAFDIAEPMDINGERWWIIPTSGHRAYPYWTHEFSIEPFVGDCPEDLPDHYPAPVRQVTQQVTLEELDL
jgi:hypothetical protein